MRNPMIFASVKGEKQGDFKADVTKSGKGLTDKMIIVHAFDYGVRSPIDIATGITSGKRQHKPVTLLKHPSPSTINFLTALVNNERITTVKIDFMMPEGTELKPQFTIELTDAHVINVNLESHEETEFAGGEAAAGTSTGTTGQVQTAHEVRLEKVELAFRKIEMTWTKGGITFSDDWQSAYA